MSSNISSIYNSVTRMTGLSGLDVDGMVSQLMQLEKTKVDTVSQKKQLLVWKQDQYREITSALQGFNNEYFSSLSSATDMRSSSAYNAFAVKYDGADTSSYFTAVAGSGAKAGEYTIKNIITAAKANVTGSNAAGTITGSALTTDGITAINSTANNNKIAVTLNGTKKEITIADNPVDISALVTDLQAKLNTAFGTGKITVNADSGKLTFTTSNTNTVSFGAVTGNTGLTAIGLSGANTSNKIDLTAHIYDIRNSFALPISVTSDDKDNDISFSINGQSFNFNSSTTSLNDIMSKVNSNTAAGVKMSYDNLNNKFSLESTTTGATASIKSSDTNGGLLGALSLTTTGTYGNDASITYNDGVNGDQVITRSTNSFEVNGITFNLNKDYSGSVVLGVSSDPTKAVELIKGFVSKYNEILDKINTRLSETREYDYPPLTDSQKDGMTEDEIKLWEDKAKSGLLSGDSMLRSIASEMRNAIIKSVEGSGLTLSSIGIKSSSWTDKGKLYVDENKLKSALTDNPDKVIDLFTKKSDVTYYQAASDPASRAERYNESGLIDRVSDIIQNNIRTNTINGKRGALLEKAGAIGDRSQYSNTLYTQINDYDKMISEMNDELSEKENSYYDQFSKLESLINDMNSQSTWLSQQFS